MHKIVIHFYKVFACGHNLDIKCAQNTKAILEHNAPSIKEVQNNTMHRDSLIKLLFRLKWSYKECWELGWFHLVGFFLRACHFTFVL